MTVAVQVGAADQLPFAWHVGFVPLFVYPVLQVYAAVARYERVLPPAMPPLMVGAAAFATVGAAGQWLTVAVQVGAADQLPFAWHVGFLPVFV